MDPRLFEYTRNTRRFLGLSVALGAVTAALVIVQAFALAGIITAVFQDGATLGSEMALIGLIAFVVVGRALVVWATERAAHGASAQAKADLRSALLEHVIRLGPAWLTGERTGELTTLCTRGIDALDAYFARYLPQLALAVIVPVAVVVAIVTQDPLAALLVVITVPLIPLFMVVIGSFTERQVARQWATLATLSGHFLDVVAGLPTLKVFGRAKAQAATIAEIGDRYRRSTMGVLRVSFLSALTLELVATLSVAVVAVSIGLRLVYGGMTLQAGLTVLLLAPEAYLPLRLVGQNYHAAAEGVGAADQIFSILETKSPQVGTQTDRPPTANRSLVVENLVVRYPDRTTAAVQGLSFAALPGSVTALAGVSGAGKSTVLAALMQFLVPDSGRIELRGVSPDSSVFDLATLEPDAWRSRVAYLPQRPHLPQGTLADALRLSAPDATEADLLAALARAGLDLSVASVLATLPAGLDTRLGEGGVGLSAGQIRRVALARVLCRDSDIVLLDEPSAALDGPTEQAVVDVIGELRAEGKIVIVVAHRPALLAVADRVVVLEVPVSEPPPSQALEDDALASLVVGAPPWVDKA